ncbi:MAG: 16S rRNA (guanine(966)-N(2))-methyltransferase RsmD [Acidobacteria bacterium]|nr:16S rRNA (guanine(966)-N(2))-methyltransferase RsmD [Acidobacteriota bacterium]
MRITKGKYQKRPLQSTPADGVRPTVRRLRETLFDFLDPYIRGARFLDLCAGSGAVGLEALSRGAAHVTFVERSPKACDVIEANLEQCGASYEHAEVVADDVLSFLRHAVETQEPVWDVAFFDPPYASDYTEVLALFGAGAMLRRKGGILVVEHLHCNTLSDALGLLRRWRVVKRGDSCLSFYERKR